MARVSEPASGAEHDEHDEHGAEHEPAHEQNHGIHDRLARIEHLLTGGVGAAREAAEAAAEAVLVPAWRRVTEGEPRWPVTLGMLAAIALQAALRPRLAPHPRLVLPALEVVLLLVLVIGNPRRINKDAAFLRGASIALVMAMSLANAWSAGRLVFELVEGRAGDSATDILMSGAAVWLTNVIAFSLWYWELDRGGPVARMRARRPYPDFVFAQMQSPELGPPNWRPGFVDYLFLSFTNATAFSPTDVLPLTPWAKLTMMAQSAISLSTVALVVARAVNILK
jgi:uncharacterized membrane protein